MELGEKCRRGFGLDEFAEAIGEGFEAWSGGPVLRTGLFMRVRSGLESRTTTIQRHLHASIAAEWLMRTGMSEPSTLSKSTRVAAEVVEAWVGGDGWSAGEVGRGRLALAVGEGGDLEDRRDAAR